MPVRVKVGVTLGVVLEKAEEVGDCVIVPDTVCELEAVWLLVGVCVALTELEPDIDAVFVAVPVLLPLTLALHDGEPVCVEVCDCVIKLLPVTLGVLKVLIEVVPVSVPETDGV